MRQDLNLRPWRNFANLSNGCERAGSFVRGCGVESVIVHVMCVRSAGLDLTDRGTVD